MLATPGVEDDSCYDGIIIVDLWTKLQPVLANYVSKSADIKGKWLLDTGVSHNITSDLSNLFIHSKYDGTNAVVIGDGSGLPITHIGSLTFNHKSHKFLLIDTLCVPSIQKNLIYVHYFTKVNNLLIEFHPGYFLVKDWFTRATLLQGQCVFTIQRPHITQNICKPKSTSISKPVALPFRSSFKTNNITNSKIFSFICYILLSKSCCINKSQQLSFGINSIKSTRPLQYSIKMFGDQLTLPPTKALNTIAIFFDHYTCYCWLFP